MSKTTTTAKLKRPDYVCGFRPRPGYVMNCHEVHTAIRAGETYTGEEFPERGIVYISEQDGEEPGELKERIGELKRWLDRGDYARYIVVIDDWRCAVTGVEIYRTTRSYAVLLLLDSMIAGLNDHDDDDDDDDQESSAR